MLRVAYKQVRRDFCHGHGDLHCLPVQCRLCPVDECGWLRVGVRVDPVGVTVSGAACQRFLAAVRSYDLAATPSEASGGRQRTALHGVQHKDGRAWRFTALVQPQPDLFRQSVSKCLYQPCSCAGLLDGYRRRQWLAWLICSANRQRVTLAVHIASGIEDIQINPLSLGERIEFELYRYGSI